MTFPRNRAAQETYLQALETRLDTAIQNADPFIYGKTGGEPTQKQWEDAWVAAGNSLPIPVDKLLYWYDTEAEIVRGIYSVIRDSFAFNYRQVQSLGVDWYDGQEGVSRGSTLFRWEIQTGNGNWYWEDNHHIRAKADSYDYDSDTLTADRDIRIFMDGTIEEVGAWADTYESIRANTSLVDYADDDHMIILDTVDDQFDIYTAPSATPVNVDLVDFTHADFTATGDATGTTVLTNSLAAASSGWLNYASMNTARGFMIFRGTIDIDAVDGECQFYWGCGSVPASVGGADGYELVFDRASNQIDLYFNTTLLHSISYTITAATMNLYFVLDLNNDRVSIFNAGTAPPSFVGDFTDVSRTLPGTNIGFGGYKGGADTNDIVISASVGVMPTQDRFRITDGSEPEMMIHDFVVYVRYNHNTTTWTLYNYDNEVPSDWITNTDYEAYEAVVDAGNPTNYDIGLLRDLWDYQQSTGYQIDQDSVSSLSFRKFPFFEVLDYVVDQTGNFSSSTFLKRSPDGSKSAIVGGGFSGEFLVFTETENASTGKVYRLNEWTDGKPDVMKVYGFEGDGVQTSFNIDLSTLSIPDDYDCLMFKVGNNQDSGTHDLEIQFNGDTGANYSKMLLSVSTSGADSVINSSTQTSINFDFNYQRTTQTDPGETEGYIYEFRGDVYKSVYVPMQYDRATIIRGMGGTWRNTDAITELDIETSNGNAFDSNFYFELYAVRTKGRHHREGQDNDFSMA